VIVSYADASAAEAAELAHLASSLVKHAPALASELGERIRAFQWVSNAAAHPYEAETHAEAFARDLRRRWLQYAAGTTAAVYRSPTQAQQARLAANPLLESFGYERELKPETLEQRCASFFPAPPRGWRSAHILFSSGQATLTAVLLALQRLLDARRLSIAHLGHYFETHALLEALPALVELVADERAREADCLIVESIACDGRFIRVDVDDVAKMLASSRDKPRAVIFYSTLLGRADDVPRFLGHPSVRGTIVFRMSSGLKLFQAGLELANVGILTVFVDGGDIERVCAPLRQLRALTGSGLRLVDAVALEAPWVFDAALTDKYERALFANNAALARSMANAGGRLFEPVAHPALDCADAPIGCADAPYCAFRLRDATDARYDACEAWLAAEARNRRVLFEKGGSFGFRGHRFEVVRPDTGDAPFLRVAMGRRCGWSRDGVIEMLCDLAECEPSVLGR
jgi:hypothetical protein